MAEALVTGAVVGAAFGVPFTTLHEAVKHVVGQARRFKSILKDLKSTLKRITPDVQKIKELNLALGRPKKEIKSLIKKMEMGKELVLKCSKIKLKPWSLKSWFKAYSYSKQLKELNGAIQKFCQVDLAIQIARTVLENSVKLDQITNIAKQTLAVVNGIHDQMMILRCGYDESKGDEDGKAERVPNKPMEVGKVELLRYLLKLRDMGSQKTKEDNKAAKKGNKAEKKAKEKTKEDNKAAKEDNKAEKKAKEVSLDNKAEENKPKEKTKEDNKAAKKGNKAEKKAKEVSLDNKAEDNKPKEKTKEDNKAAKKGNKAEKKAKEVSLDNKAEKKAEDNKPKEKTKEDNKAEKKAKEVSLDNKAEKKAEDNKPKEKTKEDNKAAKKGNKAEKKAKEKTKEDNKAAKKGNKAEKKAKEN